MIILPERGLPIGRILIPQRRNEWRQPSQRISTFGIENQTRFRLTARLNDGHVVWRGWFDCRDDADAFLYAIISGSLITESYLWSLPTPQWHPDLSNDLAYDFAVVTFLTTPAGSNQTYTSPSDWNNADNSIETLGGGGSGGASRGGGGNGSGGGGSAYSKITNFTFANPGTTTATWQTGLGGTAVSRSSNGNSVGNNGGATWFNSATDPGVGSDNTKVSSAAGGAGQSLSAATSGGTGGAAANSWGQTKNDGGRGGNINGSNDGTGGGGAGGSTGAGSNGGDTASSGVSTAGGSGDAGSGGSGGSSGGGAGGNGTEWDGTHGSGGGGGGNYNSTPAGSGGNYGAGGGGIWSTSNDTSGAGIQGIIVVTNNPLFVPFIQFQSRIRVTNRMVPY